MVLFSFKSLIELVGISLIQYAMNNIKNNVIFSRAVALPMNGTKNGQLSHP